MSFYVSGFTVPSVSPLLAGEGGHEPPLSCSLLKRSERKRRARFGGDLCTAYVFISLLSAFLFFSLACRSPFLFWNLVL